MIKAFMRISMKNIIPVLLVSILFLLGCTVEKSKMQSFEKTEEDKSELTGPGDERVTEGQI